MRRMDVADFETGAVAVEASGPEGGETTLVRQLGERVDLVHQLGQLAALTIMLLAFQFWRQSPSFLKGAFTTNLIIMCAGFILFGYQMTGYFIA